MCGLKLRIKGKKHLYDEVTPCVGVRIETKKKELERIAKSVTPCVGVRIETDYHYS